MSRWIYGLCIVLLSVSLGCVQGDDDDDQTLADDDDTVDDMGPPVVLAEGQSYPTKIAVDSTHIYWSDQVAGTVMRVALDGEDGMETLASGQDGPIGIAVDDQHVFWANANAIYSAPLDGGEATMLAQLEQQQPAFRELTDLTVAGSWVYFPRTSESSVMRVPVDGGPTEVLAQGVASTQSIYVDGEQVYTTYASMETAMEESSRVYSVPIAGGDASAVVSDLVAPWFVSGHGGSLVVADLGPGDPREGHGLVILIDSSGEEQILADEQPAPAGVVMDGDYVYWVTLDGGQVMRCARGSGTPQEIISDQGDTYAIALDDTHLYWASAGNGTITKMAL